MLTRHVSDAAATDSPQKPLQVDGEWYTVRAMVCRSCGGYLGWTIQCAYDPRIQWMEGHSVVELSSVAYQDERDYVEAKRRQSAERRCAQIRVEPLRRKDTFSSISHNSSGSMSSSVGAPSMSSSPSSRIDKPWCHRQVLVSMIKSCYRQAS